MNSQQWIQTAMLLFTSGLFAAAFVLGWRHMRRVRDLSLAADAPTPGVTHDVSMGFLARCAVVAGIGLGLIVFIWRAVAEQTIALPVSNPFDAFLVLGLLLAFVLLYFRLTRHLRSFSFFLLPMIGILFLLGVILGLAHGDAESHDYRNAWTLLHEITVYISTPCFVLGCVGGVVYLLADHQLRRKGLELSGSGASSHRWIGLPPLASIEKFNRWMVYVGFPVLTVSIVAGIFRAVGKHEEVHTAGSAIKIGLGSISWCVYAVLIHVPLNPRFRGRRAAWLYIMGFLFFIAAFVAAGWR